MILILHLVLELDAAQLTLVQRQLQVSVQQMGSKQLCITFTYFLFTYKFVLPYIILSINLITYSTGETTALNSVINLIFIHFHFKSNQNQQTAGIIIKMVELKLKITIKNVQYGGTYLTKCGQ